ncbi:hypothetical protein [Caldanaerobacter sp.]|uniref:hypothetical protein n=1 Tax=Caldanaerobacter sp. TaxID=2930036 RepID=UPI003C74FBF0
MAWIIPKVNWTTPAFPNYADFNRIEGNIAELKKAATIEIENKYFTSNNVEGALAELKALCR